MIAGRRRPLRRRRPGRLVEHGSDVPRVVGKSAGEVERRGRHDELTTSAGGLIEEARERRKIESRAHGIEPGEAGGIPQMLGKTVEHTIAKSSRRSARRLKTEAEWRKARRRERIH